MTTPTLTARLLHALKARGATEIFGIPGDFALPLFREIEREALLPLHTFSHEPAVGFAADAAARARGGLGVAAVTYGAGALNMVNAVASAYAERVPLVVISGAPAAHEITSGFVLHHQVKTTDSQWQIYHELSADRARLDDAADAPAQIARVLDTALRRSLPVYLEIPRDMPAVPCGAVPATSPHLPDPDAVAACADEMLARIRAARQPVLMVGVEVRRFGLESRVAELARRLGVPVVTTFMGRGLLAGADVPLRGTYLGLAGDPALTALVEGSDALAMLGVIVSDTNFAVSAQRIALQRTLHAFDDRVTMGYHSYHDLPLAALVEALLVRLPAVATKPAPAAAPAAASASAAKAAVLSSAAPAAAAAASSADEAALQPADIADALNALLARH
ncbi:MAG TPA: thiamine pyrophosphate-binding protein, partial [Rubrivivax sp.]|nr:thiamine pyrophosphate-binding protein [Rubrivivax sp.]